MCYLYKSLIFCAGQFTSSIFAVDALNVIQHFETYSTCVDTYSTVLNKIQHFRMLFNTFNTCTCISTRISRVIQHFEMLFNSVESYSTLSNVIQHFRTLFNTFETCVHFKNRARTSSGKNEALLEMITHVFWSYYPILQSITLLPHILASKSSENHIQSPHTHQRQAYSFDFSIAITVVAAALPSL
jgi:hypothetical protein